MQSNCMAHERVCKELGNIQYIFNTYKKQLIVSMLYSVW